MLISDIKKGSTLILAMSGTVVVVTEIVPFELLGEVIRYRPKGNTDWLGDMSFIVNPGDVETDFFLRIELESVLVNEIHTGLEVNKITPPEVDLYGPDGKYIDTINEYELLDFMVQIKRNQATGYRVMFGSHIIKLDRNGTPEYYPSGFMDKMSNSYLQLL